MNQSTRGQLTTAGALVTGGEAVAIFIGDSFHIHEGNELPFVVSLPVILNTKASPCSKTANPDANAATESGHRQLARIALSGEIPGSLWVRRATEPALDGSGVGLVFLPKFGSEVALFGDNQHVVTRDQGRQRQNEEPEQFEHERAPYQDAHAAKIEWVSGKGEDTCLDNRTRRTPWIGRLTLSRKFSTRENDKVRANQEESQTTSEDDRGEEPAGR